MASLSPILEEILASGGTVELTVTGRSMSPMLKDRVSRVRLAAPKELKRGDIPLYRRKSGAYVLHRITDTEGDTFTLCGDRQWHLERGIEASQILAVVTDFNRSGRWRSCEAPLYRFYVGIWLAVRPLRRLVFGGGRRVLRKLKEIGGR